MRFGMTMLGAVLWFAPASLLAGSGQLADNQDDSLRIAFQQAQHQAQRQGAGFRLANPENRLEADFHDGAITVEHSGGQFGLRLEAYGFGDHPAAVVPASIHAEGPRVEYRRGPLTEWYVSGSRGLEQGFTLSQRPAGADGGPLCLDLAASGSVTPALSGDHVELQRDGRTVLVYSGLRAWDSVGQGFDARMVVRAGHIRLLVDDREAVYPLTVDPWIQQQELTATAPNDVYDLGVSVSVSGDTAVIGALYNNASQGAAYVFVLSGGVWTQQQGLTASDGVANDHFGYSVSVSGNTAVIGANNRTPGAAYVFVRSGGVWIQQQELTASDGATVDYFGCSVSLSGDTAVIGAFDDNAAYVFVRSGGAWSQQQELTASDGVANDDFGYSVSVDGDTAVIGAHNKTVGGNYSQGAAYVFVRGGGVWIQQQELTAPNFMHFGVSVSVSGDTAVIGALFNNASQGAAFVFVLSGGVWIQQQGLTASDGAERDFFGSSVSVSGDTAVIGADNKSVGGNAEQGAAYVFVRSGGVWIQQQELTASDGAAGDGFGLSVAVGWDTVLIGAEFKNNHGAAYVFVQPTLGTGSIMVGGTAGASSVVLSYPGPWTAASNSSFLHISPGSVSGTGNAVVVFTYDAFTGTGTRTGTLTIAGLTLTVTQAGTNYIGPGGVVTLASGLALPVGLAVDLSGNVYIADTLTNSVKVWTASNQQVTTLVSSGLNDPNGVAVDSSGNVYIADSGNNAIKMWTASSQQVTTLVSSGLNDPYGVAVDSSGNVYIADSFNDAIKEWSASTQQVSTLAAVRGSPFGLAVDVSGNVYFSAYGSLKEWNASTQQVTTLVAEIAGDQVAVDVSGNAYLWPFGGSFILEWNASTQQVTEILAPGQRNPDSAVVDGAGNLYIADYDNQAINEVLNAFVGPAAMNEPGTAGIDSLLPVIPASTNLTGIFAPTSDQSWLTIGTIAGGVVNFSFTANTSATRTAHISILGQQITVTQNGLPAQTITFGPLSDMPLASAPFTLSANASSGLPVSFSSTTASVCTVANVTVTLVAVGTCTIQATQGGDTNWAAATPVPQSFQVIQLAQTITFGGLPDLPMGSAAFTLSATASSSLPVNFASTTPAVCTVVNATVTLVGAGTCTVQATQAGNTSYAPAAPVSQTFQVTLVAQSIAFGNLPGQLFGAAPFPVSASATSGLPVSFSSTTVSVCTVSGATVTLVGAGTCTIEATQAGNTIYAVATPVSQSFQVGGTSQTINFGPLSGQPFGTAPFTVTATASSSLPVIFSSTTPNTCTVGPSSVAFASIPGELGSGGAAVAVDGNTAVVTGAGQAYVYVQSGGAWVLQQTLTAPDSQGFLGDSVALSGDTIVAGAYGMNAGQGSVYVFVRSGGVWTQQQELTAPDPQDRAFFGYSVAVSGDTVVVGSPYWGGAGTAYIFTRSGTTWTQQQEIAGSPGEELGDSVSVSGSTILLGAPFNGNAYVGSAYVYVLSGSTWTLQQSLAPFDGTRNLQFGTSISVDGNTAIVGAIGQSGAGAANVGAAYVFVRSGTTWTLQQELTPSDGTTNLSFGFAVSVSGGTAIVGTKYQEPMEEAYVFTWSGTTWTQQQILTAPAPANGYDFGWSVAVSGGTAFVGAPGEYNGNGAVYAFTAVSTATVTLVGAGACTIEANQAGSATYAPAPPVDQSFQVAGVSQSISFGTLSNQTFGVLPITVSATATSELPVSFASTTLAVCTASGSTVTVIGAGVCTIQATQAGNTNYAAAAPVSQSFQVAQESQIITFGVLTSQTFGAAPFPVGATASSGLSVSLASTTPAVCTEAGGMVTLVSLGTCTIQATQTGSGNYLAAAPVSQSFQVTPGQYLISTYAGGIPVFPTAAVAINYPLQFPSGLATDQFGNTYVSGGNNCIFKVDPNGVLTRVAGNCTGGYFGDGGPAINAQLNLPSGPAVDSAGDLYFADSGNSVIRKVAANGIITTVAGTGTPGYSGDNGPATTAQLTNPNGVAVDSAGNLYIADSGNNLIRKVAGNGTISTVAGTGASGYSGDNGPATSAQLSGPAGVALDSVGNLYIADTYNYVIRKVAGNGIVTTAAGTGTPGYSGDNGPATSAQLANPSSVTVDSSGNLYIADESNNVIRKVAANGIIATVAGTRVNSYSGDNGPATSAELNYPYAVAVDSAGNLSIADAANNRVREVNLAGTITTLAGDGLSPSAGDGGPAALAQFGVYDEIAVDGAGNLYIADFSAYYVRKVTPAGVISTVAGNGMSGFSGDGGPATSAAITPDGLAADSAGNIYILGGARVRKVTANGTITTVAGTGANGDSGDNGPATSAQIYAYSYWLASDFTGNLYFSDQNHCSVRKITSGGIINTVAGAGKCGYSGDGGPATSAKLSGPTTLAVDATGSLYIVDSGNDRVRKVAPDGVISTYAGNGVSGSAGDGGSATSAQLNSPQGLAVDSAGNLYIGDSSNRVRRVSPGGTINTIAGDGTQRYGGDGGSALSAQLIPPVGLATDSLGNIYLSDYLSNVVRVLQPAGTAPLLTISHTHNANFTFGQAGAAYTVTLTNAALALPTSGAVTVTEIVPAGLTLVSMTGSGWNCITNVCTRSDTLAAGNSYPITVTVNVAANAPTQVMPEVSVSGGGSIGAGAADLTNIGATTAVLEINSSHAGSFAQGQSNATYTVAVGNQTSATATSGAVTVTDTLPASLTLVSMAGTGWDCTTLPNCTRSDTLPGGASYPPITVTVNVAATASSPQVNAVSVSGGGSATANATDSTIIVDVPVLSITSTHSGNFSQGQTNAIYSITVGNTGGASTSGTLTMTETVPAGLTLVSMIGLGWTCPAGAVACTRSDVLVANSSYPPITVTASVAANAPSQVTNQVGVSGGGALSPALASDPTLIGGGPQTYLISTIAGGLLPATSNPGTTSSTGPLASIAIDGSGNAYFASTSLNAVFRLDPSGNLTRVAGIGAAGYSGDSGPAASAQLNFPHGVAVDAFGDVYVADTNNNRIRKVDATGVITTVAGTGGCCFSGDGVPATSTTVNQPWGVAVDGSGNLYIADTNNQRIRKVDAGGGITTVAGNGTAGYSGDNGPATSAQINGPRGIALDSSGNLYIADTNNHRIREVAASGVITTVGGTGVAGYSGDRGPATSAQFNSPNHVTIDSSGNLYVADTNDNRVRMIAANGIAATLAGNGINGYAGDGGAATSASLYSPAGVAVDSSGVLYIADTVNQRIRRVSSGAIATIAGGATGDAGLAPFAGLSIPFGTARDNAGNIYVADGTGARVRMITPAGVVSTVAGSGVTGSSGDGGPATSAKLNFPHGLALDASGNLYIADLNNHRIRKVSTNGVITTVAGTGSPGYSGDNGPATSAQLNNPHGVTVDASGNIFIADTNNHRIRKISTSGTITTVAGTGVAGYSGDSGPAISAQLTLPQGAVLDPGGDLYIADTGNNCIREVAANGTIVTVAGNGTPGYSGDNGPATSAQLNTPWGIARDASGDLFFSEVGNSRVREVTAGGMIVTIAGNGLNGFTGDGGLALSATFQGPFGVTLDPAGNIYVADQNSNALRLLTPTGGQAVLTVNSSHNGSFLPGTSGQYTVTVTNAALAGSTSGTVTVTEIVPSGLTLVSMAGSGWSCGTNTCTRSDALTGGASYPAITVTVNVSSPAPLQVTNQVTVAGGNAPLTGTLDLTFISGTAPGAPVLVSPTNSSYGVSLSAGLSWTSASGATSYDVYFGTATPPVFVTNTSGTSYSPAGLTAATTYYWQVVAKSSTHTASSVIWSFTTAASGSCTYALSPTGGSISNSGGTGAVTVTAPAGCGWTATSNQPWLEVTAGAAGVGNGTVSYSAGVNGGGLRSAALTIGGQTFALTQVSSYIISTIAGGLLPATSISGAAAAIGSPGAVVADSTGNLYFPSATLNAVFRLDPAGVLTRIAGTGISGFSGDGGPALSAQLNTPGSVALDAAGNVYIADSYNNRIRMVTPSGTITTVAGNGCCYGGDGGPATSALLNYPNGVAVDTSGNLYIADTNNQRIRKVSSGTITTLAGTGTYGYFGDNGPATSAQTASPRGLALDGSGNLYIADSGNNRIRKLATGGTITTVAGNGTCCYSGDNGLAISAQINSPYGVAVDAAGNLYIADTNGNRIRMVATTGIITTVAGNGAGNSGGDNGPATSASLFSPYGVAIDGLGTLYIADFNNQRIRKVSSGMMTTIAGGVIGDGGAARTAGFGSLYQSAVDAAGNVYVSDIYGHRVRKITPAGVISTFAGTGVGGYFGDNGPAASAQVNSPSALALDVSGNLYIADSGNNRVRKVSPSGTITTLAGNGNCCYSGDGGPAIAAQLNYPLGVTVDASGNVFISDTSDERVRKVNTNGIITTVAGTGTAGYSGDNGPATSAQLNNPRGAATDASGNLYIAEASNNRVRRISTGGTITTVAGNGVAGYSGDTGPATSAQLNNPQGVAVDGAGNLYIAEWNNNRVREVSTAGTIVTIAGNGGYGDAGDGGSALNATFKAPVGLSVDSAGNVYVSEFSNNVLRLLTVAGGAPVLTATSSHIGNFAPGASGQYTVTVSNASQAGATSGTVTVTEAVSAGLTLATMSGTGWTCGTNTCTRSNALAGGSSYPAITVTVNVASLAPAQATNQVTVSGGGALLNASVDLTLISGSVPAAPTLVSPANGAYGVSQSAALSWNNASGATSYDVYVGTTAPPVFVANTTATTYSPAGLAEGTTYYWQVAANSGAHTASSAIWSFATGASGFCTYGLSLMANSVSSAGGTGSVTVTAPAGCGWTATSSQAWLEVTAGGSGVGNGTVTYSAAANSGGLRSATIAIGGQAFALTQMGTYIISTIAGGLSPATSAAGATVAFGSPGTVAADSTGNLYFPSAVLNAVFRLDPSGVLTRVAGTGVTGFAGDGGPALNAQLNSPSALALDGLGNLYIADAYNNRIRMVASSGTITTVAGSFCCYGGDGGPATSALLNNPNGVAVDSAGNLYIADTNNQRIRRVSNGTITTIAGTGGAGYSGDNGPATSALIASPRGLALDGSGNLYVADVNNNRIRKVSAAGTISTVAGTGTCCYSGDNGPATSAQINNPWGVAVDAAGDLYIADTNNSVIRMVALTGVITTVVGNGSSGYSGDGGPATSASLSGPSGVFANSSGNLYISDFNNQRIRTVSGGTITTLAGGIAGDGGPAPLAALNLPYGSSRDSSGNIYIADRESGRVRKVTPAGVISTVVGTGVPGYSGDNGPAMSAQLRFPVALAVDSSGNLYIADSGNNRIRKVSASGTITTVAGNGTCCYSGDNGPATSAQMNYPTGVAADAMGNIYFADVGNSRIRKVSAAGTITTVAGTGTSGYSGDNGPGTSAQVNSPYGLAVDASGNVYIGDVNNNRVRKLTSTGTISTVAGSGVQGYSGDNGPATNAQLSGPYDVFVDGAGNLYISDTYNERVRMVTPAGAIASIAGTGGWGNTGDGGPALSATFKWPSGLSVDTAGNIYLVEFGNYVLRQLTVAGAAPVLTVTSSHMGNFAPGASGQYTLTVSNAALAATTNGSVTVAEAVSTGLTLSAMAGTGWTCSTNTCTRSDALSGGGSYPPITATVNVSSSASSQVTNQATVSGGGAPMTGTGDLTVVTPPVLSITSAHTGNFGQGQLAAVYTVTVSNQSSAGNTAGAVLVTETVPPGLTLVSMAGTGWTCASGGNTCTRSDTLGSGASYPAITVTVNVTASATSPQVNSVSVSGGGATAGASANDSTIVLVAAPVDLSVAETAGPTFQVGSRAGYLFNISNSGGQPTASVTTVTDMLPAGLTYVSGMGPGWSCSVGGQNVTCTTAGSIAVGASSAITLLVSVGTAALPSVSNTVTVSYTGDSNPANNSATVVTAVAAAPTAQAMITAANDWNLKLNTDGTLLAWGGNETGQLGDGSSLSRGAPAVVPGITGVVAASAGEVHGLAIKNDGTVWAWGDNYYGDLGDSTTDLRDMPVQVNGIAGVIAVSAGAYHSLALKSDGTVWSWGANYSGQLGNGGTADSSTPVQVPGLSGVVALSAGDSSSMALKGDGTVWAWGDNTYGELGDGTTTQRTAPVQVSNLTGVLAVQAGYSFALALRVDGSVWSWGYNSNGQLGDGTGTQRNSPVLVSGLPDVVGLAADASLSLAVKSDGTVWAWGGIQNFSSSRAVQVAGVTSAVAVAAGANYGLALRADGSILAWGYGEYGELGDGVQTIQALPAAALLSNVASIAVAPTSAIAAEKDGSVWTWGNNEYGQLGNGNTQLSFTPAPLTTINGITAVAAGNAHVLALKSDGTVWAWGYGNFGRLGNGSQANSDVPVQASGLTGVVSIAAGYHFSLALKQDGTVWAWGYNIFGQLGDGTTTNRLTPVQVTGLTGVVSIAAGLYHSLAVKGDGTVWAWGYNYDGQLGNGSTTNSSTPVQVSGLSGMLSVSSNFSAYHSLAIKSDGTVWGWGYNYDGELGTASPYTQTIPAQVPGIAGAVALAAGSYHSMALLNNGTVWAWGDNSFGQLGDGSIASRYTPAQVSGLSSVTSISGGTYQSLAIKSDATLWGWGGVECGQLAEGTTLLQPTPVAVAAALPSNLAISKSHAGTFTQGQSAATYTLIVSNGGASSTSGLVAATDNPPLGLNVAAMSGAGWICAVGGTTCSRSDALAGGASYPPITVTAMVAANAPPSATNQASASGGGSATAIASDSAAITLVPSLSITSTHTGNFAQAQIGATYTVTVSNAVSTGPTSGNVTVTETVPPGLTLVSMAGTGWTCPAPGTTCTRSDVLAAGSSYPAITVTVNVGANPPASVTNQVSVAGGGAASASASDLTYISSACTYSLNPTSGTIGAGGGSGAFGVSTATLCSWTPVASNSSWISVAPGAVMGAGTVDYQVTSANTGTSPRTGTITAGGQTYTITQFGSSCSLAISPASTPATSAGGLATANVTTSNASCAWTASGLSASPASGTGNGTVTFTVPANANPAGQVLTATVQLTAGGTPATFTANQTGTSCTVGLSAASASIVSSGGNGWVNVTTPSGCMYSTVDGPSWISVTAGASGSGPGPVTLTYTVAPNSTTVGRSATLTIGNQTYTITQDPTPCSVTVDASNSGSPFGNTGGSGTLAVTANGANCAWAASSPVPWATVSPMSGTGNGTISIAATSNASSTVSRTASLSVAGQSVAITQGGTICSYALGSLTASVPYGGGTGSVMVTAPAACSWSSTADPSASWLTISSSGSGGTANVVFTAAANATVNARSGTLTVAGQSYTVTEAAAPCNYLLNGSNTTLTAAGGSGLFTFSTGTSGCSATAQSFASWLTTTRNSSADGTSGTVSFTATPNPGATRGGAIQFGGQSYVVIQSAAACVFTLSSQGTITSKAGGFGSVIGSPSASSCTPTITTDSPGIVSLGELSGLVNNLFTQPFTVGSYNSTVTGTRQMTITFGGQTFTIKQTSW